eukprot:UN28033
MDSSEVRSSEMELTNINAVESIGLDSIWAVDEYVQEHVVEVVGGEIEPQVRVKDMDEMAAPKENPWLKKMQQFRAQQKGSKANDVEIDDDEEPQVIEVADLEGLQGNKEDHESSSENMKAMSSPDAATSEELEKKKMNLVPPNENGGLVPAHSEQSAVVDVSTVVDSQVDSQDVDMSTCFRKS